MGSIVDYLESNNLGDLGCLSLSKSRFSKLTYLHLSIFVSIIRSEQHYRHWMCLSFEGWLSISEIFIPEYICLNSVNNKISFRGCTHLCKANWSALHWLAMGGNYKIGKEGVACLRLRFINCIVHFYVIWFIVNLLYSCYNTRYQALKKIDNFVPSKLYLDQLYCSIS